jgi:predicted small lipoprotein YifL
MAETVGETAKVGPQFQGWWIGRNLGMVRPVSPIWVPRGVANFGKVDAGIGDLEVSSNRRPLLSGWTIVVVSAAALALGGCGRKGGLDLPPNASTPTAANANAAAPPDTQTDAMSKPSLFNPTYGTDAPPTAAKGRKKSFILDPLLDDRDPGR